MLHVDIPSPPVRLCRAEKGFLVRAVAGCGSCPEHILGKRSADRSTAPGVSVGAVPPMLLGACGTGLHLGAVDTDFSAAYDGPKGAPAVAVRAGLDGIEAGAFEILADDWSAYIKKSLAENPTRLYDEIRAGIV
jgi:hypothetical protein